MFVLLIFYLIIVIALICVVLLQQTEGGGMGGIVGGVSRTGLVSARSVGNFLTTSTIVLAIVFVSVCLLFNVLERRTRAAEGVSVVDLPVQTAPAAIPAPDKVAPPVPAAENKKAEEPAKPAAKAQKPTPKSGK